MAGTTGSYRTLASLGITTSEDGTLSLDSTKFQKALAADPDSVTKIFSSDTGVAAKLGTYLTTSFPPPATSPSRSTNLAQNQKDLDAEKDALNARMQVIQDRYTTQFTALDTMLSQLQSTSTFLTQQLTSLQNLNSQK